MFPGCPDGSTYGTASDGGSAGGTIVAIPIGSFR
jgi:hypothetical protein